MLFRLGAILALVLFVAACETTPEDSATTDTQVDQQTAFRPDPFIERSAPVVEQDLTPPLPTDPRFDRYWQERIGDRVEFATDQYNLTPDAQQILTRQAQYMAYYQDITVTIEGHADERGTREYNLALGDRRANAAREYLVALGISPQRIRTVTFGKERPACPGSDNSAWKCNRRAVTSVN